MRLNLFSLRKSNFPHLWLATVGMVLAFPLVAGAAPPTVAVKFVILQPSNSTAGTSVTVTVEARKQNNQVDTAYQNDVTLVTSGSATGGGLVDIVNGIGTISINDSVAETVTLSLTDTQSTGLDVSSTRQVTFATAGGGGGGGGGGIPSLNQQKFLFRDDDGGEISATGFGAENVGQNTSIINVAPGTNFRLRFAVKLTVADGSIVPRLEFSARGGSASGGNEGADCATGNWSAITSSSASFNLRLSDNFIDGASTTQQLVGGPNFIAGQILESTNPAGSLNMLKNQSTEYEWSLKASQDIPLATTYSFRITDSGTVLNTYDQCPSLTTQPPPTPSRGVGEVSPTTVTFSGKAFPGAKILVVDKDARLEKIISQDVVTSDDGSFHTSFVGILQSQHSFGLVIKDKEGRTTQSKFFNVNTISEGFAAKDVVVPPTVGFRAQSVTRGNNAIISGFSSPGSGVVVDVDGKIKKEVEAAADGSYKLELPTGDLDFGQHKIRAKQSKAEKESSFSIQKIFTVSRLFVPKTDLSGDEKVDIKDWSIFLSRWASKDKEQKKVIDFNGDGKVDISDFSIFVRNIRKR